jgi:hypothetical protein
MNPVLQFINKGDYSFDDGVAVLCYYSSNGGINSYIIRRRDKRALASELAKLAHNPYLRPLGNRPMPACLAATKDEPQKAKEGDAKPASGQADESGHAEIVTFLDLKRHETYKPEDLPTPMLKELWMKNRDEWKELQYCHAQMKQANSDAGRADWRRKLIEHQESLKERWQLFDKEMERVKAQASAPTLDEDYNPFNDRSYVSKALKKKEWSDEYKVKIQQKVDTLIGHGVSIKDETVQRLRERGIAL